MANILTLAETNQFSFVCPIFNSTTKLAACLKLRELKWMGKEIDKRAGCQAAMNCSKCPAAKIVSDIIYQKHQDGTPDNYGSREPVVGKLRADVLEAILPVMYFEKEINSPRLSEAERALMLTANDRIKEQLKTAPKGEGKFASRTSTATPIGERPRAVVRVAKPEAKPTIDANIANAARSGNMAAAISQE